MPSVHLVVRSGRHRGSVVRLRAGVHRIGRSMDSDLVLSDPDVAPEHLAVLVDKHSLALTALAPGVLLGSSPLSANQEQPITVRKTLVRMADVEILLVDSRQPRVIPGGLNSATVATRASRRVLTVLALAGLVGYSMVHGLGTSEQLLGAITQSFVDPETAAAAAPAVPPTLDEILALSQLLTTDPRWRHLRLRDGGAASLPGLDGVVAERSDLDALLQQPMLRNWALDSSAVSVARETEQRAREFTREPELRAQLDANGRLAFGGHLATRDGQKRLALLQRELGSRMNVDSRPTASLSEAERPPRQLELPVKVTSVNLDLHYFETADGDKHFVGSTPTPGFEVSAIEPHRIVFKVAGRLVDFPLP